MRPCRWRASAPAAEPAKFLSPSLPPAPQPPRDWDDLSRFMLEDSSFSESETDSEWEGSDSDSEDSSEEDLPLAQLLRRVQAERAAAREPLGPEPGLEAGLERPPAPVSPGIELRPPVEEELPAEPAPPPEAPPPPPPPPAGLASGAPPAGDKESSLGPRAEQGPRKCTQKTHHTTTPPASQPLTQYLPMAGVSSVVALAPYLDRTVRGDCLPILDMETGDISAYVVVTSKTGNLARMLGENNPQWLRQTSLPEEPQGCVVPPQYPADYTTGWNSLWMTPVGPMIFDQAGALLGARSFFSLESRHPWSAPHPGPPRSATPPTSPEPQP
ncbi:ubiquitin E3 ligase; ICP0 [pteropodid alphaherpesvirus 2]|uniref:Ubiquitin E3 ligase ICP0 n=1 Tax=pteropodid alphaherpesvirus 2 TaxID=3118716 RepID=A0A510J704_9ALPH|nr:ubiquitin E3 ligase; ICP0 [pteropodid alphaherpesvirus 2]YP_010801539.1 ubiquitin E3 ligase; ICP0 [pteropodid alphaherpesvirus 2]BBM13172.1 ubiquitin E3 ligase; ICP0 [pteropodid alphaherpesvirus 2]BBM13230.1 ubiquitin E3 ligase; ICP0 [pteropodid alphaherpesvirus 2]